MGKEILTQARLKELLDYDPETGVFRWAVNRGNAFKVGQVAGSLHHSGYIHIGTGKRIYAAHRLAWLWIHGEWPCNQIDHINGVRDDNRLLNLREVTHQQNVQNQRNPSKNKFDGLLGAYWHSRDHKWQATIRLNGKNIFLGIHKDAESAHQAYLEAKRKLHPTGTI